MAKSVLSNVTNILGNARTVYADINHVIEVYKQANEDGKITSEEIKTILEACAALAADITIIALEVKESLGD